MASSLASLKVGAAQACSAGPNRRKQGPSTWWSPLFGWSSDPDYIEADPARPRPKFAPGGFTEEKARKLRIKTAEGSSFHDIMYHSAIASRLATDLSGK